MKPANDNDPQQPNQLAPALTPKQARELAELRALAKRVFDLATRLEQDLVTGDTRKRILAATQPSAAMVARMAELRRKKGLSR